LEKDEKLWSDFEIFAEFLIRFWIRGFFWFEK